MVFSKAFAEELREARTEEEQLFHGDFVAGGALDKVAEDGNGVVWTKCFEGCIYGEVADVAAHDFLRLELEFDEGVKEAGREGWVVDFDEVLKGG